MKTMPIAKKVIGDGTKKKGKGTKKLKRKGSAKLEDVETHTSLPPKVDGQLRCYLRVSTTQILWNVPNAPDFTQVRLLWWGEEGKGALFRPVDVKRGEKRGPMHHTTARYPVRAGPKQLASYFNDMDSLTLEVLSGPNHLVVGRTKVDRITSLTPNTPINGFYPVFSADQEKVAELQVSIVIESLMASYDSMSSLPTPDVSLHMRESFNEAQPVNPPRIVPAPTPQPFYSLSDDPFRSPVSNKTRPEHAVPTGVDSLIYGSRAPGLRDSGLSYPSSGASNTPHSTEDACRSSRDTLESGSVGRALSARARQAGPVPQPEGAGRDPGPRPRTELPGTANTGALLNTAGSGAGRDVVSELLERGQKLREAMIVSTLGADSVRDQRVPEVGFSSTAHAQQLNISAGKLFDTVLGDIRRPEKSRPAVNLADRFGELPVESGAGRFAIGRGFGSVGVGVRGGGFDTMSTSDLSDMEDKAIELVLGPDGDDEQAMLMRDFGGSPAESISDGDISETGDPIHDDMLLSELFYKNPDTDDSDLSLSVCDPDDKTSRSRDVCDSGAESLNEPGNMRPPSRAGSRRSSSSSLILDLEPTHDTDSACTEVTQRRRRKKRKARQTALGSEGPGLGTSRMSESSRASESSRVSFDPTPSDTDESRLADKRLSQKKDGVDGLSVERLTLLGRVHVARVVIDSLSLSFALQTTPTKASSRSRKGKPPRPVKKASTYFIEYSFPVVATSRDKYSPNTMATEVMRVASKKVSDGMVHFGHRSVFPVLFDGEAVDKWWRSALVFKVYSRAPTQQVPTMLGNCAVPLKSVLKSESLYLERSLEVRDRSGSASESSSSINKSKGGATVGLIKLVIELASDSKDFAKALARTRLAEMTNPRMVALPQDPSPRAAPKAPKPEVRHHSGGAQTTLGTQTEPRPLDLNTAPLAPPTFTRVPPTAPQAPPPAHHGAYTPLDACTSTMEALTLHALVMVPEGQNITTQGVLLPRHGQQGPGQPSQPPPRPMTGWAGRDCNTRNLYLSVRMFWSDDTAHSDVCWGTVDPAFKFTQVVPVLLTSSFLERLRNNLVVVEVWDKKTAARDDELVGIVKLPLHQFYVSYRDCRIAASLLKSQYPVVSIDTCLPIVSPFTGSTHGQLKVLLAMGSTQQVSVLQGMKGDAGSAFMVPERPLHYLERQHLGGGVVPAPEYNSDNIVDHTFEVSVEGVRGLRLLETMIWGEADCFVQYHFPTQTQTHPKAGPAVVHAGLSLKTFRTATTLCIPDPVFNDVLQHKIAMPEGTPVQREILTACAGAGGGSGGVPMEVWCRYYYPNTRDQVIAKAVLPLAKLCAMVTMKRRGEPSVQTFSLPLVPVGDADPPEPSDDVQASGLLDITITYRTHTRQAEPEAGHEVVGRSLPGAQVCISVSVLRACALKAAAVRAAGLDPGLQYAAEVGVNVYITVSMSFLQKQDMRTTRTVARSFAPDFSYHMDFPAPLLWTQLDCDALSLAEIIDSAECTLQVWHETPGSTYDLDAALEAPPGGEVSGRRLVARPGDVLLGSSTIPLIGLLKQATGIHGWLPVTCPSQGWETPGEDADRAVPARRGLPHVVGGLEVALRLAHQEDRERVLHAGRSVGWAPQYEVEARDWSDADDLDGRYYEVVVAADLVCCPLASVLLAGQSCLDPHASIYVRYKCYDRNAVCSKSVGVTVDEDYVTCDLRHNKTLVIPSSGPFFWYLNEERLEVQVWLTHPCTDSSSRPRSRDKLVGAAYLPLGALGDTRRRHHRLSGVYPLFKPGSANLGGACARAHVTLRPHAGGGQSQSDESSDDCRAGPSRSPQHMSPAKPCVAVEAPPVDTANTFSVYVNIERALHLPSMADGDSGTRCRPSCYVTYQSADLAAPRCTDIVSRDDAPRWGYSYQVRLHTELLTTDTKNLVFKVWHKSDGGQSEPDKATDRVVGFVSVDLNPLRSGFTQISGWYNIMDFNGVCQGQIKIAVTPHESLPQLARLLPSTGQGSVPSHRLPSQLGALSSHADGGAQGVLARFSQHYENVKHFHESLGGRLGRDQPHVVPEVSRSALFNSLRSNMSDLDSMVNKLKTRLKTPGAAEHVAGPYSASSREHLDHTGHSTHTETSALTNSQQFLPMPGEGPTSTDGELHTTLEGIKEGDVSLGGALSHLGTSALLSGLVRDRAGGLLPGDAVELHSAHGGHAEDPVLAGVPPVNYSALTASHRPLHRATHRGVGETGSDTQDEDVAEPDSFRHQPARDSDADDSGEDLGGEVVVVRALNDISNVNFSNMMSQDYTSKMSEDSWFGTNSPRRANRWDYNALEMGDVNDDVTDVTDMTLQKTGAHLALGDTDLILEAAGTFLDSTMTSLGGTATTLGGTMTSLAGTTTTLGGTMTSLAGTTTTLGGTMTSLGGTATTLGSVGEDDPYGRTLVGGQFNKTMKFTTNYDDSWATNNASGNVSNKDIALNSEPDEAEEAVEVDVPRRKLLEDATGSGAGEWCSQGEPDSDGEDAIGGDRPELSVHEKSHLKEEDPGSFLSGLRRVRPESSMRSGISARKAAMHRRQRDRHRSQSSSEEDKTDSDSNSVTSGRRRPTSSRPKLRSLPARTQQQRQAVQPVECYTGVDAERAGTSGSEVTSHDGCDADSIVCGEAADVPEGEPPCADLKQPTSTQHTATSHSSETSTPRSENATSHSSQNHTQRSKESHASHSTGDRAHHREGDCTQRSDDHTPRSGLQEGGNEADVMSCSDSLSPPRGSQPSRPATTVPNFFLPSSDLEQSMRALRTATLDRSGGSSLGDVSGSSSRQLLTSRFSASSSAKSRPMPDPQHSQRIAKIFSSKFAA